MIKHIKVLSRSDVARIKPLILANDMSGLFQLGYGPERYDKVYCISINGTVSGEGIEGISLFSLEEMFQCLVDPNRETSTWENLRILNLEFDDIHPDTTFKFESCKNTKYMTLEQAIMTNIILEQWNDQESNDLLIVHCYAGLCRSAGIARFAGWLCDIDVVKDNPHILNNDWVENLMFASYAEWQQEKLNEIER